MLLTLSWLSLPPLAPLLSSFKEFYLLKGKRSFIKNVEKTGNYSGLKKVNAGVIIFGGSPELPDGKYSEIL